MTTPSSLETTGQGRYGSPPYGTDIIGKLEMCKRVFIADPWSSGNTLASQSRDRWFDPPLHLTYLLVFRMRR
ncbi:hypothetical protein DPMN_085247 [Dreissena polymorpha]|uniref:Uncharacterized protein n=1 Tax=Dreissena polymorpha TaxID=45954 RepID=A0A9D3YDB1_DREPO|nr:hypothetical protein DPMN_085247 [Dreissena polymorpha]